MSPERQLKRSVTSFGDGGILGLDGCAQCILHLASSFNLALPYEESEHCAKEGSMSFEKTCCQADFAPLLLLKTK